MAVAQEAPRIHDLAFMTGHWERTTNGMHVEQVFLSPEAGTMVGLQRRTQDNATLVSDFFVIEETGGRVVCRFKHFENDYTTYEDRNGAGPRTFTLIEWTATSAVFEERTSEGSLYLRYRIAEGNLAVAVGTREELDANKATESLHQRKAS
jgi:hypothetical protein